MATHPAEKKEALKPSAALSGKFEIVGVEPGLIEFKGKTYDLSKISLEEAEMLHEKHAKAFPYLRKLGAPVKDPKNLGSSQTS